MSFNRRDWLTHLALASVSFAARPTLAAPDKKSVEQRRLANRLELWSTFSQRNQSLVARYHSTRWSSLLESPLEVDGQLLFLAPDLLVLRDAGFSGAETRIEGSTVSVRSTQSGSSDASGERRVDTSSDAYPGLSWCAERMLKIFAPGPSDALIAGARHEVPRGRTPRLTLRPPREHLSRLAVRRRGSYVVVDLDDVIFFETRDELVWAVTADDRFSLDLTLTKLEEELGGDRFFRSHRGALVRIDRIAAIKPKGSGVYELVMDHPEDLRVTLSRDKAKLLRERIPFTG